MRPLQNSPIQWRETEPPPIFLRSVDVDVDPGIVRRNRQNAGSMPPSYGSGSRFQWSFLQFREELGGKQDRMSVEASKTRRQNAVGPGAVSAEQPDDGRLPNQRMIDRMQNQP